MSDLTRRLFLQTPAGAAALGLLPAAPVIGAAAAPQAAGAPPADPMILHVNDAAAGAMTLFVGSRAIPLRDPRLLARLVAAAG